MAEDAAFTIWLLASLSVALDSGQFIHSYFKNGKKL